MAACRWLKCSFCLLSLMCHLSTQALLVGDPIAVGRSTDLEYTQGQPCKLFFLNIIKRKATFRVGNYLSWVVRHTEEHPYDWTHYSV